VYGYGWIGRAGCFGCDNGVLMGEWSVSWVVIAGLLVYGGKNHDFDQSIITTSVSSNSSYYNSQQL